MALTDIVNVVILASTATPSRPSFGTTLALINDVPVGFTNRTMRVNSLKEMTDAGFVTTSASFLLAQAYFAQNPRPRTLVLGRRALKTVQSIQLTVLTAVTGDTFLLTVAGHELTYTVPGGSPTTTTIAAALVALIDALSEAAAVNTGAVITVTPSGGAGTLINIQDWSRNIKLKDLTADPGIVTDLTAVIAEDEDWYGIVLDSNSKAEVVALAPFVETLEKVFGFNTADTEVTDVAVTNDVMSALKALGLARTFGAYDGNSLLGYSAAAWQGSQFAASDPGGETWAYKKLAGVKVDAIRSGERTQVLNKHGNVYYVVNDINITDNGRTASGEWIDVIRFLDWVRSELRVQIFALLVGQPKIPYTDEGIEAVKNAVKGVLSAGVAAGGIANDTPYTVTAPRARDVDAVTRASRILPDVNFTFRLAGAIQIVDPLTGEVSS